MSFENFQNDDLLMLLTIPSRKGKKGFLTTSDQNSILKIQASRGG